MEHTFAPGQAVSKPASDILVVTGTSGDDEGIVRLIDLMGSHGSLFYQSATAGKNMGPAGLFARDDVVMIKVNSQWDERGGTNTDLLKSIIKALIDHPDGFNGEIVVADNGQAQYGSTGKGGNFNYSRNNAQDKSQSVQKVVDFFTTHKVSTFLWDNITTTRVKEYSESDDVDGYVVNTTLNPRTGAMVSYPKFKTKSGTTISFKSGVWDQQTRRYRNDCLKLINVPVLKAHFIYGVTGCVKHYQGIVSDKLTAQLGARAHNTIVSGGLGTEMVETRLPTLNIIDAIWVNARPQGGPGTRYDAAEQTNIIVAGTDPVALDYWSAKHILMKVAREKGYSNIAHIDPDNTVPRSFGQWLRLSMEEIKRAGYQVAIDESHMNIAVVNIAVI